MDATFLSSVAAGLATGAGLIIAIGAQNAFVLRQGLKGEHVALVVLCCILGDVFCITAGTAGMGALVTAHPAVLSVVPGVHFSQPARVPGHGGAFGKSLSAAAVPLGFCGGRHDGERCLVSGAGLRRGVFAAVLCQTDGLALSGCADRCHDGGSRRRSCFGVKTSRPIAQPGRSD